MAHVLAANDTLEMEPGSKKATADGRVRSEKIRIEQHSGSGMLWFVGWLFTIGILHLPFWKGLLALVIWPYYLGAMFSSLLKA